MSNIIYTIILNWNGKSDTLLCLESLQSIKFERNNIIVVDNGSTDNSINEIKKHYPSVTILDTGLNLGYAEGNNVGIRYAINHQADYILLLNNDTIVSPDLFDNLLITADKQPTVGIFGALIFYMHNPDIVWFAGAHWNKDRFSFDFPGQDKALTNNLSFYTDYACGAALFFRTEVVKTIGYLDNRFFLVWEESDWCLRAKRAGYECRIVPNAHVWHKVGASFEGESSPLRQYFSYRNRLLWAEKNLLRKDLIRILRTSISDCIPNFSLSSNLQIPAFKRFIWAINSWYKTWQLPSLRAKRRGIIDYLFRNFGNCPDYIRLLKD